MKNVLFSIMVTLIGVSTLNAQSYIGAYFAPEITQAFNAANAGGDRDNSSSNARFALGAGTNWMKMLANDRLVSIGFECSLLKYETSLNAAIRERREVRCRTTAMYGFKWGEKKESNNFTYLLLGPSVSFMAGLQEDVLSGENIPYTPDPNLSTVFLGAGVELGRWVHFKKSERISMAYGLKGGSDFVDISKKEIRDGFTGAGYAWANLFVRFNFTSN